MYEMILIARHFTFAALKGLEDVVVTLIEEFNCDTRVRGNCGRTLLHYACIGGNVNIVKMLILQLKADINAKDSYSNTPLHDAALYGRRDVVLSLIAEFQSNTSIGGRFGRSFLHSACSNGQANVVRAAGSYIPPSLMEDDRGDTPLHLAAASGDGECVEAVLQLNHPVLVRNWDGKTPVDVARGRAKAVLDEHVTQNKLKEKVHTSSELESASMVEDISDKESTEEFQAMTLPSKWWGLVGSHIPRNFLIQ